MPLLQLVDHILITQKLIPNTHELQGNYTWRNKTTISLQPWRILVTCTPQEENLSQGNSQQPHHLRIFSPLPSDNLHDSLAEEVEPSDH